MRRVLVANRGEIACRILRTLRRLGIPSVSVFTPPDALSPHVWLADGAMALPHPKDYLDGARLIAAAHQSGATAIHPGYGFLSQSPAFADAVRQAGLTFIGPHSDAMTQLGDKRAARALAQSLGIPVVPGAQEVTCTTDATELLGQLGFPLLLKAAGGGGGRGMRQVQHTGEWAQSVAAAAREAHEAFGDARLLVERYVHPARHIEMQMMGDGRRVVVVGERECSLQRRYQKVLEEGPVTHLTAAQRQQMVQATIALGEATHYLGAGTAEFLLGPDGDVYFLEVNTRLQVEHPVTEMCTGLDLVALQLAVAQGDALTLPDVSAPFGHAIEVRLNAEDPSQNFLPQTGSVQAVHWPQGPGVRVDAGVAEGSLVGPDYDSMLAKIIAWAPDRAQALATLAGALDELRLLGVPHNQAFLLQLLGQPWVAQQQTFTTTLESHSWPAPTPSSQLAAALGALPPPAVAAVTARRTGPWACTDSFWSH